MSDNWVSVCMFAGAALATFYLIGCKSMHLSSPLRTMLDLLVGGSLLVGCLYFAKVHAIYWPIAVLLTAGNGVVWGLAFYNASRDQD